MVGHETPVKGEEVGCDVPKYLQEPFKCLGISVYSTNYERNNGVCLKAMRFWEPTPSVKYDKALDELKKVIQAEINSYFASGALDELKKVIRAEINSYFASGALNKSQELKKVIRAEINGYFASGARRLIAIGNGKAKWDSDAGPRFKAEQAFSTTDGYGCAGWSASANNWKKPWPIMIWYEFSSTHIPAQFLFRQSSNNLGPKEWRFVGSKEDGCTHGSTWETLCGHDKTPVAGEEVGCDVPNYFREPFKCLGISVYSTNFKENNMVCLIAMQFWERLTSPA